MSQRPECSVLVCTYQRADLLRGTLDSLCRQTVDRSAFEVVVVDDGSTDDTASVVERFQGPLQIRYAWQRNSGLAAARNHALFMARGPIVLLQDDDDLASPRLLEEHLGTHRQFPSDGYAVLGHTELSPDLARDPLMRFVTEIGQFLFSYPNLRDGQVLDFSRFWGGRSSCKRSFLLDHGVFDPVFRFGCEDIELAWRLRRFGLRVVYNARAVTTTVRPFDVDQFCDRLISLGRSNWVFSRLHAAREVQRWTEVEAGLRDWALIAPVYDALRRAAREVDRLVRRKLTAGLPVGGDLAHLHETYWAAFRASKVKGIAERAAEDGEVEPPRVAPASRRSREVARIEATHGTA